METVYIGYNNSFRKQILESGALVDLSVITKVALQLHGTLYDSETYPTAFDYTTEAATGHITFTLGNIPGLTEEARDRKAELILYAPDYPNGYVWALLDIKTVNVQ